MPYIQKNEKLEIARSGILETPGQLNYLLTNACINYLDYKHAVSLGKICYTDYNDVIGALEACKLEFYRRMVAGYEDKKMKENGDVYGVY